MVTKNRTAEKAAKKPQAGADPRAGSDKAQPPAKTPAPPAVERSALADPLQEQTSDEHAADRKRRKVDVDDEVTVTVPRAFRLQIGPGVIVSYAAGVQEMPKSHADHQYSKDNGVELYEPASRKK